MVINQRIHEVENGFFLVDFISGGGMGPNVTTVYRRLAPPNLKTDVVLWWIGYYILVYLVHSLLLVLLNHSLLTQMLNLTSQNVGSHQWSSLFSASHWFIVCILHTCILASFHKWYCLEGQKHVGVRTEWNGIIMVWYYACI